MQNAASPAWQACPIPLGSIVRSLVASLERSTTSPPAFETMSLDSLAQLQEMALTDAALRQALDAASSSADLLGLASLHSLKLSEASAQAWLENKATQSPSAEILASISQGLSASDEDETAQELTEDDLAVIAGGGMVGEAGSTFLSGEAV